jgi:hypothetical protein
VWLRTYARGLTAPYRLTTASYRPAAPPFGAYRIAIARALTPEPQPGHRLYVIVLASGTRAGRYLFDLVPDHTGRLLVDLWAEL